MGFSVCWESLANMSISTGSERVKFWLLRCLALSAALFLVLGFVPWARQGSIFRYADVCDYRYFIQPVITSERPYSAPKVELKDACYPSIAYCAVRRLATDRGCGWRLSIGEKMLLASLFCGQLLGAFFIVWMLPRPNVRAFAVIAIIMSPPCICTVLRGNPSGWAFACVCVFVLWYKSESAFKRMVAAISLGLATSLKLTPCLFGCLYLSEAYASHGRIPWRDVAVAATSAIVLTILPFGFFGGYGEISQWISNAFANASYYCAHKPVWGFIPFANQFIDSKDAVLPSIRSFAAATRILAVVMVLMGVLAKGRYCRFLYIGAAMVFLTHHDYGGAYLIPAFVIWMSEKVSGKSGVILLLEAVSWFILLTPLQIPNPVLSGTLNYMLANEFLFLLLVIAVVRHKAKSLANHDDVADV